ncbi:uncharacterized protein L969DRAFT_90325 [Mixia osmundae IAM 14324]|uniref:Squalene synthase n=1 Tax=Mixia osmundae (strain CBS 9802 / IAM 14324 / JCM 22182 / KY 12970) TaxID=764103 RepID=G7E252_MIXOS|nr:uncharacterized protein L969DRAFT_90325 [Mixia osmundae IAM 14324]KEI36784.1 hypothetical protein L969DRAFT_90325 [Mixia osmundae IAM 14324]GAA96912.1 hypothetical protein E5Q_03586 [Mixia osmundae IAM 14324]
MAVAKQSKMSKYASYLLLALTHPDELKAAISYSLWRDPLNRIEDDREASGLDRHSMQRCWFFLDMTSRSFAAVIKELEPPVARAICIFYLVLRGLDTVEDDMTIPLATKEPVLVSFHERLSEKGWTFTGNGPDEKDRQLLVEFDNVIQEMALLDEGYRTVITDIAREMGAGMAKYARMADENAGVFSVDTLASFDLYCHYVAGLVGEGLSRIFAASGREDPQLGKQLTLSNSMGLMLQKTNILRDFREDIDDGRLFWPKEIWGKYAKEPRDLTLKENSEAARWALSEMTVDALTHAVDALNYLTLLKDQAIFCFCAVPQVMAIATLEECFDNLDVYQKNVKIRRTLTASLIYKTANPRDVAYFFRHFVGKINQRKSPADPSYIKLSVLGGQIDQWCETRYPSWVKPTEGRQIPSTVEEATAQGFSDARIRQLPSLSEDAQYAAEQLRLESGKMTSEDIRFISIVVAFVGLIAALLAGIVALAIWYINQPGDVSVADVHKIEL